VTSRLGERRVGRILLILVGVAFVVCFGLGYLPLRHSMKLFPAAADPWGDRGYSVQLPENGPLSDNADAPRQSSVRLLIDGRVMQPAHSDHATIMQGGGGAFSHWSGYLFFSLPKGIASPDEIKRLEIDWPVVPGRPLYRTLSLFLGAGLALFFLYRTRDTLKWAAPTVVGVTGLFMAVVAFLPYAGSFKLNPDAVVTGAGHSQQTLFGFASDAAPFAFPAPDRNESPSGSPLRLWVNGIEAGQPHQFHTDIVDKGDGRFSHWGNGVVFSMPPNAGDKVESLEVRWPFFPKPLVPQIAAFALLLWALALSGNAWPRMDRISSIVRTGLASGRVNAAAAGIVAFIGAWISVIASPEMPVINLDSATWFDAISVVPPYYSYLYQAFDKLWVALGGGTGLKSIIAMNALIFYGGLGFLGAVIAYRASIKVLGPLAVLLVMGADSITVYVLFALTEAPQLGFIFFTIGLLLLAQRKASPSLHIAAVVAVIGGAWRPVLAFLLPLVGVGGIAARPKLRTGLVAAGVMTLGLVTTGIVAPAIYGRAPNAQMGITLYPQVYHLVATNEASPTKDATFLDRVIWDAVKPFLIERDKIKDPAERADYDSRRLSDVANAAADALRLNGVDGEVSKPMQDASFRIMKAHPGAYVLGVLEHIRYAVPMQAGQWRFNWMGSGLAEIYSTTENAASKMEVEVGRIGLAERLPRVVKEAENYDPAVFNFTEMVFPRWFASAVFFACVVITVLLAILALFRKLGPHAYFLLVAGSSVLGFLLVSCAVCPLIPRQMLVGDGMLLIFFIAMVDALAPLSKRAASLFRQHAPAWLSRSSGPSEPLPAH